MSRFVGIFRSGEGNDTIYADDQHREYIKGGKGNDRIVGGKKVDAGDDDDLLVVSPTIPFAHLKGGGGNDTISDNSYSESLNIILSDGFDNLEGDHNDDEYYKPTSESYLENGSNFYFDLGLTLPNFSHGVVTFRKANGQTQGGSIFIHALESIENAIGGTGNNYLRGNSNSNRLEGGIGNDTITGGGGADTFFFDSKADGMDVITDFKPSEDDEIEINIDAFGPVAMHLFEYDQQTGTLYYNDYGATYNNSLYFLTETSTTWDIAQIQAQELGGNLVTINDLGEQDWLEQWLDNTVEEPENFWIGLTDEQPVYEYKGHYYLLSNKTTWEEAQIQAQELGGNLVTLNDEAERDWLQSKFGENEYFWIGLTDKQTEGTFKWISGETSNYYNHIWHSGEPNNWRGDENYVHLITTGKLNDSQGTANQRGIIEINSKTAIEKLLNEPQDFRWISGEISDDTPPFTNWNNGQPNNQDDADYVELILDDNNKGKWNNISGGEWEDLSAGNVTQRGIIEIPVYEYNGHYYLLSNKTTWEDAQNQAQELGGNLVTLNNEAERSWLRQTFGIMEDLWIGLTDEKQENKFEWISGETSTYYTNIWNSGEPNNWRGDEDYVYLMTTGKLNDSQGTANRRGIIEIDPNIAIVTLSNKPQNFDINNDIKISGKYLNNDTVKTFYDMVELFADENFQGKRLKLTAGEYHRTDLFTNGFNNNSLSSIKIPDGWGIALYDDDEFDIPIGTYTSDIADLPNNVDNKTTSLIVSGPSNDFLTGGDGDDTLNGLGGDDKLDGLNGNNYLIGGAGADTFILKNDNNTDFITDFNRAEGDKIEIDLEPFGHINMELFSYDANTGNLYYGNESSRSILATLSNKPSNFNPKTDITIPGTYVELLGPEGSDGTDNGKEILKLTAGSYSGRDLDRHDYMIFYLTGDDGNNIIMSGDGDDNLDQNNLSPYSFDDSFDPPDPPSDDPFEDTFEDPFENPFDDSFDDNNGITILTGDWDSLIVPDGWYVALYQHGGGSIPQNYNQIGSYTGGTYSLPDNINGSRASLIVSSPGDDSLIGWDNDNNVFGDNGIFFDDNGIFFGDNGDNIKGLYGDDIIEGKGGNDTLEGGLGDDTYVFDTDSSLGTDIVIENQKTWNGSFEKFTPINQDNDIDTLDFSQTTNQSITIDLSKYNSQIVNENLTLILDSALGIDIENVIGGEQDDSLMGNNLDNSLDGGAGNDTLDGKTGNDIMSGGRGDDIYFVDSIDDQVLESRDEGRDEVHIFPTASGYTLPNNTEVLRLRWNTHHGIGNSLDNLMTGTSVNNLLEGQAGDDNIISAEGDDILNGGDGDDSLDGGIGNDTMSGGRGNDIYFVHSRDDEVIENPNEGFDEVHISPDASGYILPDNINIEVLKLLDGTDDAKGNNLDNLIHGNSLNNRLEGSNGDDNIYGHEGYDVLIGGIGVDFLDGGDGDDYLYGEGQDILTGGSGADSFIIESSFDQNHITDFNEGEGDKIVISDDFIDLNAEVREIIREQFQIIDTVLYFEQKPILTLGGVNAESFDVFTDIIIGIDQQDNLKN